MGRWKTKGFLPSNGKFRTGSGHIKMIDRMLTWPIETGKFTSAKWASPDDIKGVHCPMGAGRLSNKTGHLQTIERF